MLTNQNNDFYSAIRNSKNIDDTLYRTTSIMQLFWCFAVYPREVKPISMIDSYTFVNISVLELQYNDSNLLLFCFAFLGPDFNRQGGKSSLAFIYY